MNNNNYFVLKRHQLTYIMSVIKKIKIYQTNSLYSIILYINICKFIGKNINLRI